MVLPLPEARKAQELSKTGHSSGKIVLEVGGRVCLLDPQASHLNARISVNWRPLAVKRNSGHQTERAQRGSDTEDKLAEAKN